MDVSVVSSTHITKGFWRILHAQVWLSPRRLRSGQDYPSRCWLSSTGRTPRPTTIFPLAVPLTGIASKPILVILVARATKVYASRGGSG